MPEPINREHTPFVLYSIVGVVLLTTPFGFKGLQGLFFFYALRWSSGTLHWLISPAAKTAAHSSSRKGGPEPTTAADYQRWLFCNTHEKLLPNQPIDYYRALYQRHRSNQQATAPAADAAVNSPLSKSYIDRNGTVTMAPPLPPLPPHRIALVVAASCSLGALAEAAGSAFVPHVRLSPWLPASFFQPPVRSALLLELIKGVDVVLSTAPLWLPRALGAAAGVLCVSMAARPPRTHGCGAALVILQWSVHPRLIQSTHASLSAPAAPEGVASMHSPLGALIDRRTDRCVVCMRCMLQVHPRQPFRAVTRRRVLAARNCADVASRAGPHS